jgi:PTH1 family peptidyl-tRNA hydrolase
MKLIVGLGNPGEKYEKTRHNLGFLVVDKLLRDFFSTSNSNWEESKKFKSNFVQFEWKPKRGEITKVILLKPQTYMNDSGLAVSLASEFFKVSPSEILIVHDEVDLPLGSTKIRFGGGAAGHKGVTSVMEKLGTDKFWRLRLGVGHPRFSTKGKSLKINYKGVDKFVLDSFGRGEAGKIKDLVKRGSKAIQEIFEHGVEISMNRYNTK